MRQRREFLKTAAIFGILAACNPDALFGPPRVNRKFFGHMLNGGLLTSPDSIDIPIGTYRDWNNGASLEWVYRNNWEGFERAIQFALKKNTDLLHVLAGEPTTVLPSLGAWRAHVSEAVMRAAGRVGYWEVWNEPVYSKATPKQMADYAGEAYSIIKQGDPSAVVLSPSFNELLTGYGYDFAAQYMDEPVHADVIAFHSYDGAEKIGLVVGKVKRLTNLEVWNTETVGALSLEPQARAGVSRVVLNGQIEQDYDTQTPLGALYMQAFDRLAA